MRGDVVKKGKQYYAVIYEGVDPTTGRERRRWHPGGPLKRDAERLVNDLVKRKDDGTYRGPDRLTLGEYLADRWLPGQVSQLSPSTYDSYRRNIDLRTPPHRRSAAPEARRRGPRRSLRRTVYRRPPRRQAACRRGRRGPTPYLVRMVADQGAPAVLAFGPETEVFAPLHDVVELAGEHGLCSSHG